MVRMLKATPAAVFQTVRIEKPFTDSEAVQTSWLRFLCTGNTSMLSDSNKVMIYMVSFQTSKAWKSLFVFMAQEAVNDRSNRYDGFDIHQSKISPK